MNDFFYLKLRLEGGERSIFKHEGKCFFFESPFETLRGLLQDVVNDS